MDEVELEAVRVALRTKLPVEPWDLLEPGDPVDVVRGPLAGLEGTFVRQNPGVSGLQCLCVREHDGRLSAPLQQFTDHRPSPQRRASRALQYCDAVAGIFQDIDRRSLWPDHGRFVRT